MAGRARAAAFLAIFLFLSLAAAFAAGELFVRISGHYDADGTFFFHGKPVRPFALPVQRAKQLIDQYLADPTGFMQYDRDLGWTNR
ncbi:MAG TPA: hypothetical protein VFT12_00660, partial [Thermoanaerobaculia bacterium]|nr:hypothetical protein [Thermoanaerobaculia bacterium]